MGKPHRTRVAIDAALVKQAGKLVGETSATAAVQRVLADFVRRELQRELRKLKGRIEWVGDLNAMRELRGFDESGDPPSVNNGTASGRSRWRRP